LAVPDGTAEKALRKEGNFGDIWSAQSTQTRKQREQHRPLLISQTQLNLKALPEYSPS